MILWVGLGFLWVGFVFTDFGFLCIFGFEVVVGFEVGFGVGFGRVLGVVVWVVSLGLWVWVGLLRCGFVFVW